MCGLLLGLSAIARAQAPAPIAIWYRSGSGCPDGDAFVRSLANRSVHARLAQVGDAIDFVVTVGPSEGAAMSGVLERQTASGTVAIRRVDDASCEQVAEALALTLALATEQAAATQPPATAAPTPAPASIAPESAPMPAAATMTTTAPTPAAPQGVVAGRTEPAPREPEARTQLSIGLSGSAASGVAPGALLGIGPFIELELGRGVLRPALRVMPFAAFGSGTRSDHAIDVRLLGARLAGCPVELSGGSLGVRPCVALELADMRSEGDGDSGLSDRGLWLATEIAARATWPRAGVFSLEAELGLALPWLRYTLQSGDSPPESVHRTAALSLAARIGAVVHFP